MSFSGLCQFSIFFRENFWDWFLDVCDSLMRRTLMWLNLYGRQAVRRKLKKGVKRGKNAFFVFLPLFWAYVGQPDDHIGWGTLMPFASINPTHPRTNLRNFREKILRIGEALKMTFCLVFHFLVFGYWVFQKIFFFSFFLNENHQGFHMR